MAGQQFCLKWNNHQGNLLSVFNNLLSKGSLVDVTLACEGSSIKAHKVVLSACSPFFEEIFENNPCKHPVVILKDLKFDDLKVIIQFMYKGEINVTQDRLSTLLKTAENLKIKGLTEFGNENQSSDESSLPLEPSVPEKQHESSLRSGRLKKRTASNEDSKDSQFPDHLEPCSPEIIEDVPALQNRISSPPQSSSSHQPAFKSNANVDFNVPKSNFHNTYDSHKDSPNRRLTPEDNFRMDTASEDYDGQSFQKRIKIERIPSDNELDIPSPNWTQSSNVQYQKFSSAASDHQKTTDSIKPDSPQDELPTQIEQDISRGNDSIPNFDSFDPGNSADSFSDQSFPGHSLSMPIQEASGAVSDVAADNLGNQSSSMNFSQDSMADSRNFSCPSCDKYFKYRRNMTSHFKQKHGFSRRDFACHLCSQKFGWSSQLSNHLDSVHNVKKEFECTACERNFHHYSRALFHVNTYHCGQKVQIKRHHVS